MQKINAPPVVLIIAVNEISDPSNWDYKPGCCQRKPRKLAEKRAKNLIHCCLAGRGSIAESKRKYRELKVPIDGIEHCFECVFWGNQDLVIT